MQLSRRQYQLSIITLIVSAGALAALSFAKTGAIRQIANSVSLGAISESDLFPPLDVPFGLPSDSAAQGLGNGELAAVQGSAALTDLAAAVAEASGENVYPDES
jgi:hypothetical protein